MTKWYIRVCLIFHTKYTDIRYYTKGGQGLRETVTYKNCCGKQHLLSVKEELFKLTGKHMRRARRKK